MKKYFLLLSAILVASFAFGQKKDKTDAADLKIDSLTQVDQELTKKADSLSKISPTLSVQVDSLMKVNHKLATQFDSVSKEQVKYIALYRAIKEKVIKHDFDPERMSLIIDSLVAHRDSTFKGLKSSSAYLKDSIAVLNKQILQMKAKLGEITVEDAAKVKLVLELRQLKELLDTKVITQTEFDIKKTMLLQKWQ